MPRGSSSMQRMNSKHLASSEDNDDEATSRVMLLQHSGPGHGDRLAGHLD
jgi:hypothetical protein